MVNAGTPSNMVDKEIADFQAEVAQVDAWFKTARFATAKVSF